MRYGAVNKSYAFLTQRSTQRSSCLEMLIKSFAFVSPKAAVNPLEMLVGDVGQRYQNVGVLLKEL